MGFCYVAGVDEVGRGCLAGPVVAAAVVLHPDRHIPGVCDSKAVPAPERERGEDDLPGQRRERAQAGGQGAGHGDTHEQVGDVDVGVGPAGGEQASSADRGH